MKATICDANREDASVLASILRRAFPQLGLEFFADGESLLRVLEKGERSFPIVFLDVCLPGISGLETARLLRAKAPQTNLIFVTRSTAHYADAFDVEAYQYFVKPVDAQKMERVVARLLATRLAATLPSLPVKTGASITRVPYADITYVEISDRVLSIHCCDGSKLHTYKTLSKVKEELNDPRFLQCSQSYIVNLDYVSSAVRNGFSVQGDVLPISRARARACRLYYYNYMRGKI